MGGDRQASSTTELPAGVEIHYGKLRIVFRYRGVRCRECLKLVPSKSNIKFAADLRIEILNAIGRGTFNYVKYFPDSKYAKRFGYKPPSNITVGEMLETYLKHAEKTLQTSTYKSYRNKTYRYLIPAFEPIPVRELTPAMIREWIKEFNLTIKTIKNALIPLRAIIDEALVDEIIEKNPLDNIILAKLINKEASSSDYEVDPFSKEEIEAILNVAEGQVKNLFQFAFFTGLRTGELIALEWGDIDWIKGNVCVTRSFVEGEIKSTKTKAGKREVLLLPPALEALKAQKIYTFVKGGRVFHAPFSNQPWSSAFQIRHSGWLPLLKRAGVRYRNPYQTRHTYASMMLSKGENIMWVARQMGHVNTEMVMRIYGKWIPDNSVLTGYKPTHNWASHIQLKVVNGPDLAPKQKENEFFEEKTGSTPKEGAL